MISRTDARPSVHSTLMISTSNGVRLIRLLTATSASALTTKCEVIITKYVVGCQVIFSWPQNVPEPAAIDRYAFQGQLRAAVSLVPWTPLHCPERGSRPPDGDEALYKKCAK